jgi:hypothetical protein
MTIICKNCDHPFKGNFCSNCGQTAKTQEIDFKSILHEIQLIFINIDKGFFYTTRELFSRPGHTIRAYLEGRRVKHFKPISYILVLSTIYTLLIDVTHKTTFIEQLFMGISDGAKGLSGSFIELLLWMKNHYAYTTLISIPITSLASYLAFFRAKYNYVQHIILNAFIAGQKTVVFLLTLLILYFVESEKINGVIDLFSAFLGIVLNFWTYYQFFNATKPFKRVLLTILSYFLIGLFFSLIMAVLIAISMKKG